jgi:hypothetical protein
MSRIALAALILLTAAVTPAFAQAKPPDAMQLPPQPKVHPAWMPAGAIRLSPCVQGMGEHWASPKNLPFGPIYGSMNGKPVFTEIMIAQNNFAAGKSFRDQLKPLPGTVIDHVDIEFEPHGHPGYPAPHYDVHAYFVAHGVHSAYCPDGAPNLTSK